MLDKGDLKSTLSHVLWIGGGPDAGKTSVATALCDKYGFQLYSLDEHAEDHWVNHLSKDPNAFGHTWLKLSQEERWIEQSPEQQVENVLRVEEEDFPCAVEDLLTLPNEPLIVVEGNTVPVLVEPLLSTRHHGLWFVPTDEFKQDSFYRRGKHEGHNERSDPEKALRNHLLRDKLFTQRVQEQALAYGLELVVIDGSRSLSEVVQVVERHFRLSPDTAMS